MSTAFAPELADSQPPTIVDGTGPAAGFRQPHPNFAYPPIQKGPQSTPGLFDAELQLVRDSVNRLGQRVVDVTMGAPANLVGWVFDGERFWWRN